MDKFNYKYSRINCSPLLRASSSFRNEGHPNPDSRGRYFDGPAGSWEDGIGGLRLSRAEKRIRWQALQRATALRDSDLSNFTPDPPLRPPYNFSPRGTSEESLEVFEVFPVPGGTSQLTAPPNPEFMREESSLIQGIRPSELPLPEDRSAFPYFRSMKFKKRIGICAIDHPKQVLTHFQLQDISATILEKILSPEGEKVKPRFFGVGDTNGFLVFICGDHTTVSWVKSITNKLRTADGTRLRVVEEPEDKTFVAVGYFPKSDCDSNSRILKFLSVQNEGLDCSQWKILDRDHEKKRRVRLTLSIDWGSREKMKARGSKLNYKFGSATFFLETKRGIKGFNEEDFDDENGPAAFEDFPRIPSEYPNQFAYSDALVSGDFLPLDTGKDSQIIFSGVKDECQAKVAQTVKKPRNSPLHELSSRQRYLRNRNKIKKARRKMKKRQNPKVHPLEEKMSSTDYPAGLTGISESCNSVAAP